MKRQLLLFSIALIIGILSADITKSYKFIFITVSILCLLISFIIIANLSNRFRTRFRTRFKILRKSRQSDILDTSMQTDISDTLIKSDRTSIFPLIGILVFYTIGAIEFLYLDKQVTQKFKQFNQQQVIIKGTICSRPEDKDDRICCEVKTKQINMINGDNKENEVKGTIRVNEINGKILLTIYRQNITNEKAQLLEYGREIELSGILTLPKGIRNPGGFDYRRYLAGLGVSATIYAKGNDVKTGKLSKKNFLIRIGLIIRDRIAEVVNNSLPKEQAALMNAMLTGYRERFPDDLREAFSDSGLIHIMAVSGLHVGFIILPFVFLFNKLGLKKKIANPIIIVILFIYILITGYQPSVIRAVIMATIVLIGQMIWKSGYTH